MTNSQKVQRLVAASAFATGLLSIGVAASAQTAAAPAPATTSATSVAVSTTTTQSKYQKLESATADARRMEFRFLGTSL